jgi:hypothetical protein
VTPEGYPESFAELWRESTPVMRWRLAVILLMLAGLAVELLLIAAGLCVAAGAVMLALA